MTVEQPPPAPSPMPGQYLFWWGALLLVVGGLIGAGIVSLVRPASDSIGGRSASSPLRLSPDPLGSVSDFTLIERSGRQVSLGDLVGRVWIADFFFTSCAGICPVMSSAMADLQDRLADVEDVMLVSISVDPERDEPKRLRHYAKRYGADPKRWWFLTGEKEVIYRLSRESFRLGVEEVPEEERQPNMEEVLHSSKFVLMDRKGRIRGYYDGHSREALDSVVTDTLTLLAE